MNKKGSLQNIALLFVCISLMIVAASVILSNKSASAHSSLDTDLILKTTEFLTDYTKLDAKFLAQQVIKVADEPTQTLKEKFQKLSLERSLEFKGLENYYGKIRRGEFEFNKIEENYNLKIENIIIQAEKNGNSIKRTVNINIVLDKDGNIISQT